MNMTEFEKIDYSDLEARYASTESYIEKMSTGKLRSLIVNGPPGVGKTYSVENYLKKYAGSNYKMITGQMTPLSLYGHLYKNKVAGSVLVLDDIDSVFKKLEGVNILKAAMDTKEIRNISWASSTHLLGALGIPGTFEYSGGVILISNVGFDATDKKIGEHLNALKDRSFSISISDRSNESLFKQVCFMVLKRDLLKEFNFTNTQKTQLLKYIEENLSCMNTVSLRVAFKLAMLIQDDPLGWKSLADDGLVNN
jgi:DNA polymerase III delta prime subunit